MAFGSAKSKQELANELKTFKSVPESALYTVQCSVTFLKKTTPITGKSLSEALIFASTNQQYDDRLFIELQVQYMKIPSSNLGRTCTEIVFDMGILN